MSLDFRLDRGYGSAVFIVQSFPYDTFFAWIRDGSVIPIDYQLGGGSGGAAFTVKSFSCETLMPDLEVMQG